METWLVPVRKLNTESMGSYANCIIIKSSTPAQYLDSIVPPPNIEI